MPCRSFAGLRVTKREVADARAVAARCLAAVLARGRSLDAVLADALSGLRDPRERALARYLCYGVLRWSLRLDALLAPLLRKPLRERDADVRALLLAGLFQLEHMATPAHAAVGETAGAARALGKPWAVGLINATLRSYQRRRDALIAAADARPVSALAHPEWLLEALQTDWPGQWQAIAEANNREPPMWLRVNARRGTRANYAGRLSTAGFEASASTVAGQALRLETPADVGALPGFADGDVSVQDAAAQLAAALLAPRPGERVLDACAAPGGKTCHLLEMQPELAELVAVDRDGRRLERVRENLGRLGLSATLIEADATGRDWWDGRAFDRILLDAPCTGTGVIRRHPDIKVLRRPDDVDAMARLQQRLLSALWPLLAPGGRLVYATCSVLARENDARIGHFLGEQEDARPVAIDAEWGRSVAHGRQILPGEQAMDGFYYACIERCS